MTVVTSILGPDRGPYAPHGTPVGENIQEAEVAGETVKIVTNPNRPLASTKMLKKQADKYLADHPEAFIYEPETPEPDEAPEPESKAVHKSAVEDKAVKKRAPRRAASSPP